MVSRWDFFRQPAAPEGRVIHDASMLLKVCRRAIGPGNLRALGIQQRRFSFANLRRSRIRRNMRDYSNPVAMNTWSETFTRLSGLPSRYARNIRARQIAATNLIGGEVSGVCQGVKEARSAHHTVDDENSKN